MANTYNDLIDRSVEVAKETEEKANTASRVGYLLRDIVDYANTNIQRNSSDIYSLQGRVTNLEQKDYNIDEIRELSEQNASDIDRIDRDIINIEAQSVSAMQKSTQAINTVNALSANVQSNTNAINTLNGDETTEGSVAYQIAQIIADAPEAFDTLKEIADWIAEHPEDTAAMNAQIQQNTSDISGINTRIEDMEFQSNKVGALKDYHGDPTTDVESYTSVKFVNDVSNNFQQAISSLESSVNAKLLLKEDKSNKVKTQDVTEDVLSSEDKFLTAAATNSLVTGISGDVSALTAQVNSNTSNIATNTANIATNTSDITSLKTSVGTNTSNIAALRVDVNGNIADILAIEQKIADYKHVVYLTQAEYDALEVKEEDKLYIITDLTANCVKTEEFNLLESRVSSNETQIGTNTSDIASLQTTVSGHTTSIATNASDIASLQSTVSGHTTSIATHTTQITSNTNAINILNGDETTEGSVAYQIAQIIADAPEAFDTLKEIADWIAEHPEDTAAMNAQIQQNTADIATNASDIASLQTTVSGHTTSVATNTSNIASLQTTVSGHTTSLSLKENLSNKSAEYNSENASSTDIYPSMAAITGILTSISNTYEVLTNKLADLSTYQGNVQTDTDTYLSIKAVYQALDTFRQGLNSVFESKSGQSTFLNNATITAADNMVYVGSENISALTVNSTNSMDYSVEFNTVSTLSASVTVTFSNVNWGDDVPFFEPGKHYICYVHNNYGTYKAYTVA